MQKELLMIGSTCVDVIIPVERLPKTGGEETEAHLYEYSDFLA